jgi:hypothetical protein
MAIGDRKLERHETGVQASDGGDRARDDEFAAAPIDEVAEKSSRSQDVDIERHLLSDTAADGGKMHSDFDLKAVELP